MGSDFCWNIIEQPREDLTPEQVHEMLRKRLLSLDNDTMEDLASEMGVDASERWDGQQWVTVPNYNTHEAVVEAAIGAYNYLEEGGRDTGTIQLYNQYGEQYWGWISGGWDGGTDAFECICKLHHVLDVTGLEWGPVTPTEETIEAVRNRLAKMLETK